MAVRLVTTLNDSGTGAGTLGFASPSVANDLLIVFIERSYADTNQSAPSGWTEFSFSPWNDGSGSQCQAFWRRANDTSTDDFAITDGGNHFLARGLVIREASRGTNPFDFTTSGSKTTASTSVTVTGGTTVADGCLVVSAVSSPLDSNNDPVSGWTNASLASITGSGAAVNSGDGGSFSFAYGIDTTAGTVDDTTATVTSSTNCWCMLAIRPEALLTAEPADSGRNKVKDPTDITSGNWINSNSTDTANSVVAPDGSTTGDTLTSSAATGAAARPLVQQVIGLQTIGTQVNFSIYAKPGTKSELILGAQSNAYGVAFSLTGDGSVLGYTESTTNYTHVSSAITKVGDWYRCSIAFTVDNAVTTNILTGIRYGTSYLLSDGGNTVTYSAGDTLYLWGAQVTFGSHTLQPFPYGAYNVTGKDATLTKATSSNKSMTGQTGSFAVSGVAAGTYLGRLLTAAAGSHAVTGNAAGLERDCTLTAGVGAFSETGQDAGLLKSSVLLGTAGSFSVAGQDATLTKSSSNNYSLTAAAGSVSVTGQAAGIHRDAVLTGDAATTAANGVDAGLRHNSVLPAQPGTVVANGVGAGLARQLRLTAAAGSVSVSGQPAAFQRTYRLVGATGTAAVTGQAAGLRRNGVLPAGAGSAAVTGQAATFRRGLRLTASTGSSTATGNAAGLQLGRYMAAAAGSIVVTGQPADFRYQTEYKLLASPGSYLVTGNESSISDWIFTESDGQVISAVPIGARTEVPWWEKDYDTFDPRHILRIALGRTYGS